jgi:hypothetical protein
LTDQANEAAHDSVAVVIVIIGRISRHNNEGMKLGPKFGLLGLENKRQDVRPSPSPRPGTCNNVVDFTGLRSGSVILQDTTSIDILVPRSMLHTLEESVAGRNGSGIFFLRRPSWVVVINLARKVKRKTPKRRREISDATCSLQGNCLQTRS